MNNRGAGILLHISSLPSLFGIGDLGPESYRFVDFLADAGMHYWQILPLNPTSPEYDNSPYHSQAAFASNPLLISPEKMVQDGYLPIDDINQVPYFNENFVDFQEVIRYKDYLFSRAYDQFKGINNTDFFRFCQENSWWLDDASLFFSLKREYSRKPWNQWPDRLKRRNPAEMAEIKTKLSESIEKEKFLQFLFIQQWQSLRAYCKEKGVMIIGDLPIYVDYDSVDVWVNPQMFNLDTDMRPITISGVPPDYFSSTGQLWENPIYNWDYLKQTGYTWWINRFNQNLALVDLLRIDHFRGLVAYWEVPFGETTAINGKWTGVPIDDFLHHVREKIPGLPVIAEDLGVITPDVIEIRKKYQFPGMRVLEFAFIEDTGPNPHAPHNHVQDCIVYTGTHDNNPVIGWFQEEIDHAAKDRLFSYLGYEIPLSGLPRTLIRMALMSVAHIAILPMQDILGLGSESRMNRPGINTNNWRWRVSGRDLTRNLSIELRNMIRGYGRE